MPIAFCEEVSMAIKIVDRLSGRVRVLNNLYDTVEISGERVVVTTYMGDTQEYTKDDVEIETGFYDQVFQLPNGNTFIRRS